jgi:hypothetical protein
MKRILIITPLILFLLTSCSKDEINIDPGNPIIGTWTFKGYQDDVYIYERNSGFIENQCYRFEDDGSLTVRQNSGFCGTPPITYANYPGTWSVINDTLVQVQTGYWGGELRYKLDIESVDPKALKMKFVYDQ